MSSRQTSLTCKLDSKTETVFKHKGYQLLSKLGQGAYGEVFKGIKLKTKEFCAVKIMNLEQMSDRFRETFLPREIKVLMESHHDNIIQVWDIFRSNSKIYIFMEFAANGDISGYLRQHNGIKENLACHWFMQTSEGLFFLHETLHYAHRDIKLDNMLLDDKYIVKLTDFGFAREVYVCGKIEMSSTFCGTLPYNSVQIVEHKQYNPFKSDVWSLGVVFFIMMHNRFPFQFRDRKLMLKQMHSYPSYLRSRYTKQVLAANRLIEDMLNPDERKRCSIKSVTRNEWLRDKVKISQHSQ